MSSSPSSSSTSSSSSSSSSSEGPVMTHDLCQVLINDKHSVNHRRKRKSVVLHPSSGQQSWLLSEVERLQKEVKQLKKENATLMHLNWKLQENFITANFPHVTVPQVKQRMGNKLRDKRQLQIRTASINPAHWMLQQS